MTEKNRSTVTEGIPSALPALARAAKLQRKARAIGMELPGLSDDIARVTSGMAGLVSSGGDGGISPDNQEAIGELLFAMVNVARALGVEPETALRARAAKFRMAIDEHGWDGSGPTGTD